MALSCPRCSQALVSANLHDLNLQGCARCGGVWLDPQGLGTVLKAMHVDALNAADAGAAHASGAVDTAHQLNCPTCKKPLDRLFMAGNQVEVDRCDDHGTWFDAGELRDAAESMNASRRVHPGVAVAGVAAVGAGVAAGAAAADPGTRQRVLEGAEVAAEVGAEVAIETAAYADPTSVVEVGAGAVDLAGGAASGAVEIAAGAGELAGGAAEVAGGVLAGSLEILAGIFSGL